MLAMKEIRKRFKALGFVVSVKVPCPILPNKIWKYGTAPDNRAGGHGHFDTKPALIDYLFELEKMRAMNNEISD